MEFKVTRRGFIYIATAALSTFAYNPASVFSVIDPVKKFDPSIHLRHAVSMRRPFTRELIKIGVSNLLEWGEERIPRRYFGKVRFIYSFYDYDTAFGIGMGYYPDEINSNFIYQREAKLIVSKLRSLIEKQS